MLEMLQRFDPPGIFATSLAERLELLLRDQNRFNPAMVALLSRLDLLAKRDFVQFRRICDVYSEGLVEMVREIKALNPKPSSVFDTVVAQLVMFEVLVCRGEDGSWVVEFYVETLPRASLLTTTPRWSAKKPAARMRRRF